MGYANWQDHKEEILFSVDKKEFGDHCKHRAQFHTERYKVLKAQEDRLAVELKDFMHDQSIISPSGQVGMVHLSSGTISSGAIGGFSSAVKSSVDNLTCLRQKHQGLMQLFNFASEHLREETYKLTEAELRKWEFID